MSLHTRMLRPWLAVGAALGLLAGAAWADPPARVGRLAWIAGDVSLRADPAAPPAPASPNWPVTGGMVLDTGPSGRAELTVGSMALRLDVDSEVEVQQLDDRQLRLRLNRGTLALRSATPEDAAGTAVETPLGRFTPAGPGSFRLGLAGAAVDAIAWQGGLAFDGSAGALTVLAGQHARLQEAPTGVSMALLPPLSDDFTHFVQSRDAQFSTRLATQYVSPQMTGIESLDAYGRWQRSPDYGNVWVPDVGPDWAPYRDGRWAWVAPWGWTWVAAEPWGFAPFHYGRWALWSGRWAWVPGAYVARPVYAPALVAWNGPPPAPGIGVSATIRIGAGAGWFPLAPHEVYVPPYPVSTTYVHQVNVTHVTNVTEIDRVVQRNRAPGGPGALPMPARHFAYQNEPRAVTARPEDRHVEHVEHERDERRVEHGEHVEHADHARDVRRVEHREHAEHAEHEHEHEHEREERRE